MEAARERQKEESERVCEATDMAEFTPTPRFSIVVPPWSGIGA
jgi:hypothetical protein